LGFCTQCGSTLDTDSRFCGHCGAAVKGSQSKGNAVHVQNQNSNVVGSKPWLGKNKLIIVGLVAITIFTFIYMAIPKKLSEKEYVDLVVESIVKDQVAQDDFSDAVVDTEIDFGLDPDWSEEYKELEGPAKALKKDYEEILENFEEIKPPDSHKYDHENFIKAFNARKNMAENLRLYMKTGNEKNMDLFDEYEDQANDHLENSEYLLEQHKERIMKAYRKY